MLQDFLKRAGVGVARDRRRVRHGHRPRRPRLGAQGRPRRRRRRRRGRRPRAAHRRRRRAPPPASPRRCSWRPASARRSAPTGWRSPRPTRRRRSSRSSPPATRSRRSPTATAAATAAGRTRATTARARSPTRCTAPASLDAPMPSGGFFGWGERRRGRSGSRSTRSPATCTWSSPACGSTRAAAAARARAGRPTCATRRASRSATRRACSEELALTLARALDQRPRGEQTRRTVTVSPPRPPSSATDFSGGTGDLHRPRTRRRARRRALALRRAALGLEPARLRRRRGPRRAARRAAPPARGPGAPAGARSASARLRDWLRASWATARTTGPQRAITRAFCSSLSASDAATSKVASTRDAVTFACWPPGPEERLARSCTSRRGRSMPCGQVKDVLHRAGSSSIGPVDGACRVRWDRPSASGRPGGRQ